jgi:hypothetical protein
MRREEDERGPLRWQAKVTIKLISISITLKLISAPAAPMSKKAKKFVAQAKGNFFFLFANQKSLKIIL